MRTRENTTEFALECFSPLCAKSPQSMKTFLFSFLLLIASCSTLFGQGWIAFQNFTSPDSRILTNDLVGNVGYMEGTAQWVVGLYMAPAGTADPLSSSWQLVVTSTNRTGFFRGLFTSYNPFQVNGYAVGTTYATQARGWDILAGGPRVGGHWYGESAIGSVVPASAGGPFQNVFGTGAGQLGGFQIIAPIPEPSSFVLLIAGGLISAAFYGKRRKIS
jgi:hypothetical protein